MEEDSEQTSNEATLSYLDYLANLDSEEVRQEVAKRSAATKEHTRNLLHYVEISGPYSSTVSKEKPNSENQAEEEGHKGAVTQENFCLFSAKKNCWYIRLNSIVMACYRVVIKFWITWVLSTPVTNLLLCGWILSTTAISPIASRQNQVYSAMTVVTG